MQVFAHHDFPPCSRWFEICSDELFFVANGALVLPLCYRFDLCKIEKQLLNLAGSRKVPIAFSQINFYIQNKTSGFLLLKNIPRACP
jgi:hypothetical protein